MEDPNKDYLTHYRSFFEYLLKSDLDDQLPVKIANYNLTEDEIEGEITTWCLQYIVERDCPTSLASILCKRVYEEISRVEPELCGYRPQEQVYQPLQLMQETIKKLAEVCTLYTDNARLSELPPPPSSLLHDPIVSLCGIKNIRRTMEDRYIAIQDLHTLFNVKNAVGPASYYAVFDGHNGSEAATYANCHLHHYLVQSKHYPHNPEAALRDAFALTDKRFLEKTAKRSIASGATALCALLRPEENMLYVAWLGDSQAILVRKGVAHPLVNPHRPERPDEMARIQNMGGSVMFVGTWRVAGNLAVSRAIGDKSYKPYITSEPDIQAIRLTGKEDYLILASDGLWDVLTEQMVAEAVDSYLAEIKGTAEGVSKHLVQLAKKQCSRDNISCITIFLRDPSELADNKDHSSNTMEVQELDQQSSNVTELWMRLISPPDESAGGRQNGRMDDDDLGPETDVDSVDDVLLSPSIAAAKAIVSQTQEKDVSAGEEVTNDVGDNDIVDSGEESDEEWNYIPGVENLKDNKKVQQIQKELTAEEEEDMESQLNPNAAEFVPVFPPPNALLASLEKELSSSPAKGAEQSLENIVVPTAKDFFLEASKRPSELEESLKQLVNKSLNDTTLNGGDITGLSSKAVYGGDDDSNILSSINNSTLDTVEVALPLNDTNPFSPTHVTSEKVNEQPADTIQDQMVQDHFSVGFKSFDPMTQSMNMMEDEGQHEDETSPDVDFMSSEKPDLLSPEANQGAVEVNEALEAQTSSSGFDSESGPDDGDHIPPEQCNVAAAAATVGISFGEDIENTKAIVDDSHPIEKIEQTISPSISPMPLSEQFGTEKQEIKEIEKIDPFTVLEMKEIDVPLEESGNLEYKDDKSFESNLNLLVDQESQKQSEEPEKGDTKEYLVTGVTPNQFFNFVQKLEFNQDLITDFNKIKEEEPESDSGFEIVNASEAYNDPDFIESGASNKLQQNTEDTSLMNGVMSNCVPDLLLQPTECDVVRQSSPVRFGVETTIIADLEKAMLDNAPSIESTKDALSKLSLHPLETEELISSEVKSTSNGLQETKSPFLFDSIAINKPDPMETTLSQMVLSNVELENINVPSSDNENIVNEKTTQLINNFEIDPIPFVEVKELMKEDYNAVGEKKCEEMGESPVEEDVNLDIKDEHKESSSILKDEEKMEFKESVNETLEPLIDIRKEEIKEHVIDVLKEEKDHQSSLQVKNIDENILEIKEDVKECTELKINDLEEVTKLPLSMDEEKVSSEVLPAQPTPPTTPAPGVKEEDNKQELLAAAIAAAGVGAGAGAAVAALSTAASKVEAKSPAQKKPTASSVTAAKKPEISKVGAAAKTTTTTTKSPAKTTAAAAVKKAAPSLGAAAKPTTRPTSAVKTTTSSTAPSTKSISQTTKIAPSTKPTSKPSTPTTKTPATTTLPAKSTTTSLAAKTTLKPRTPPSTKPAASATTTKAPIGSTAAKPMRTTVSATTAKPSSATAPKRPETATTKKTLVSSSTTKAPVPASKAPVTATKTSSSVSASKPITKAATTTTVKSAAPKAAATTMKTSATSATSVKAPARGVATTAAKTTVQKTAPTKPTANNTAAKSPITKTKPAAPTAIKKPLSDDKNVKDAANNKLSASKQTSTLKKQETKTKPSDTKVIELTQEPIITTTNGHIENGINNEESSPVEISYPQIV